MGSHPQLANLELAVCGDLAVASVECLFSTTPLSHSVPPHLNRTACRGHACTAGRMRRLRTGTPVHYEQTVREGVASALLSDGAEKVVIPVVGRYRLTLSNSR